MYLIKISANKSNFKTIKFNKFGLNFIVAKQKNDDNYDVSKTYNGVGKSLVIKIIHFCLGADSKHYNSFCSELVDWEFYLDFEIKGTIYRSERKTSDPNRVILNGKELSINNFNKIMQDLCFNIPNDISYLSFRSLIPFFIRPNRKSYVNFDEAQAVPNPYQKMLYNSFLLGLNVTLAQDKHNLRVEQDRIQKFEKNFEKDDLLRKFLLGKRDVSLTIDDLDDQISKLENDLKDFKVAENYYDIQIQANKIEKELFELRNKIILLSNNLDLVNESLQIKPSDENARNILKIYEESNIYFSELITKRLEDLEEFYKKLIDGRKRRLYEQKIKLEKQLSEENENARNLQIEFGKLMVYLGEHGALDVFVKLSEKLSNLKSNRDSLKKYHDLQIEYRERLRNIEKEQIEQSGITDKYLIDTYSEVNELRNYFRDIAKRFYPNNVVGLTIENNDGSNKQRFNIEAKIESDNSDGINNVKIFCYDLTLLFKGKNHKINFIFHDSRLFDGIDDRQKAELISVLYEKFSDTNNQYIASINQNQIKEMKYILGEERYKEIIEDNTILVLTDEDVSEKLLGVQVDIEDK